MPTSTSTPAPTPAPAPTSTPAPTPAPTSTPAPAPTPTPTSDEDRVFWTPSLLEQVHPRLGGVAVRVPPLRPSSPDALIDLLVAKAGLGHAVAVLHGELELGSNARPQTPASWRVTSLQRIPPGLLRLRTLLVAASEAEREAARIIARSLRPASSDIQRAALTYLFPDERAWFAADLPLAPRGHAFVLASADDPKVFANLKLEPQDLVAFAPTFVDGCGIGLAPVLATVLQPEVLIALGHDAAMWALIVACEPDRQDPHAPAALALAAGTQPRRALRLIAPLAADRTKSAEVLRRILTPLVRRHGALVEAMLPTLDPSARRAIEAVYREIGSVTAEAAPDDLPPILRAPPWRAKTARKKPVRVDHVVIVAPPDAMSWAPGERERYGVKPSAVPFSTRHRPGEDLGTTMLATLSPAEFDRCARDAVHGTSYLDGSWLDYLIAQRELAALPYLARMLVLMPADVLANLGPYAATRLAPAMAEAFREKKSLRAPARAWLLRHPAHAAAGLIAAALGAPGKPRLQAELALRMLAKSGHEAAVLEVARSASGPVEDAVLALLAFDPLDQFPARLPTLPPFCDACVLPAPELTQGRGALPAEAVSALLTMLAFSDDDEPYAGLALVKAACEPRSLERFAWALFESWLTNGAPSKAVWCMHSLGHFGDDATARKLAALIREWPGESANARAVAGLDVLARIGSDVALMHLNRIALKVKFRALQARASEKIEDIAEARGLTRDELEDRLAPDLGLDSDGSMQLDFGPRTFTVGFDEQLRPFVSDAQGSRLKDLPKPNKADDQTRARAAGERWSLLKKDARTSAGLQIGRLENAMGMRRRFRAADFVALFVRHPLMFHIVRRLVWATFRVPAPSGAPSEAVIATFRVAEDRTFASIDDDTWTLPEDGIVGLPHPLELGAGLAATWSRVLADYELTQPFMQLGRPTFQITEAEAEGTALHRLDGVTIAATKLLALAQRSWRRGSAQDGGTTAWLEKPLAGGRIAILHINPGFIFGAPNASPEQHVERLNVYNSASWWASEELPLSELDPVELSELVRDLEGLRSGR